MIDRLLSSDTHIIEPPDLWQTRVDRRFRDDVPHTVRIDDAEWCIVGGHRTLSFAGGAQTGERFERTEGLRTGARFEEVRPGANDPQAHLRDNEQDGVVGSVLYPTEGPLLYRIHDPALLSAVGRAYNDWLAEFCGAAPERLKGVAMLNVDDVHEAVQELHRAKEIGLAGALIPTALAGDKRYDDPRFEPLWAAAQDLAMPLSLHLGANRGGFGEDVKKIRPSHFTIVDFWVKQSLADMVFSGIFDRYPKLRVGCIEHELGWIPHFLDRLDYTYTERQGNRDYVHFDTAKLPSELFQRNVFVSFQDDELGIRERATIGINGLVWGSDYPHTEPARRQGGTTDSGDRRPDQRSPRQRRRRRGPRAECPRSGLHGEPRAAGPADPDRRRRRGPARARTIVCVDVRVVARPGHDDRAGSESARRPAAGRAGRCRAV